MAERVCPPWMGYLLLNPLRRFFENPAAWFDPLVTEGMRVLEAGPGMGYFTLPLAARVGPRGRVFAVELQSKMIETLRRRAERAGLIERIEIRSPIEASMGVVDLAQTIDLVVAIHVVHELPDAELFFREACAVVKPEGKLLVVEPKGHVTQKAFSRMVESASVHGWQQTDLPFPRKPAMALLRLDGAD